MRLIPKLFVWLFVLLAFAVLVLYLSVETNGKPLFEHRMTALLRRPVTVSQVRFVFPAGIRIDDLVIEGLIEVKEARAYVSFPVMAGKTFFISQMVLKEPAGMLTKTDQVKLALGDTSPVPVAAPASDEPGQARPARSWSVVINELDISQGAFRYLDTSKGKNFSMDVKAIDLKAKNVAYPLRSSNISFNAAGIVTGETIPFSGSTVEAQGWIDPVKKNMDAQVTVKEPSGTIGLSADMEAKDNDLVIAGNANINNLSGMPGREEGASNSMESFFMDALESSGIKLNAAFRINTRLDDFEVSSVSFTGEVGGGGQGSLRENLKSISEKFEEFGKQLLEEKQDEVRVEENTNAVAP